MRAGNLHSWDLSYAEARALQTELAGKVCFSPIPRNPKRVAGLDCAFSKDGEHIFAAIIVLKMPSREVVETVSARKPVSFPYIPGLLSFREAPVCLAAVEKLTTTPDVFLIDGQGIAHPRRLGLAAHLGLFLNKPTIGCAKSRLTGRFTVPGPEKGDFSPLTDSSSGAAEETIGVVLRTRTNVKPLFISVGHKCTLDDSIAITLACTTRYRLPEPTRLAHNHVSQIKR